MGLGTDTKSKSYIRIMEGDLCLFKLCPETNLLVLRNRRQVWSLCLRAQGGKDKKKRWVVQNDPPETAPQHEQGFTPNKPMQSLAPKVLQKHDVTQKVPEKPTKAS